MAEVVEITLYKYSVYSSRDGYGKGVIRLYGSNGYIGFLAFMGGDQALPSARKYPEGWYGLYYRYDAFNDIVDMLRNESPVYLIYNPVGSHNSCISTSEEIVGEEES
jgi:hypothetical protein